MSLGDALRLLRAQKGGVTPLEIEAALPELPKGLYRQIEQRYRVMGDEASIGLLAGYFETPSEELLAHLPWSRKALSRTLLEVQSRGEPIELTLATGAVLCGEVAWWDLGAIGLRAGDEELVVQRHAVRKWDPRASEETPAHAEPSGEE